MAAGGCVDDELEAAGFQKIDGVGTAFVDFENGLAREAGSFEGDRSATGGEEREAELVELAGDFDGGGFIAIVDADEERAGIGDGRSRSQLSLAESLAEAFANAHDFAG